MTSTEWNSEQVGKWLESRIEAARLDQTTADKRGYEARDDYDLAAAEEWVCRNLKAAAGRNDRAAFADRIKHLLGQDDYPVTGVHDDQRFERAVRANLRKIAKMAKADTGFGNTLHFQ